MMGVPADGPGKSHFHLTFVFESNLLAKIPVVSEEPL